MSFFRSNSNTLKKLKISLIYFLFILVSISAQPFIEFGQNYHIIPENNIDQKFPYGAFDSNGVFHLVWVNVSNSHKDVYYARSINEGFSFSEPVRINSHASTVVAYVQSGPKLVIRGEEIIVVFMDDRTGYTSVYINVSTDAGMSWDDDIRVSDQPYIEAYSEIGVGIDGKLHLIYYSYNQNYSFNSVRYSTSPSGSIEFSSSVPVGITNEEMEPCDCCQPDIVIADNGDLYIGYRNNISNLRLHYIVKKEYGSDSFQEPIPVSYFSDYVSYCPSSGPSLSIENNNIASGFYVSQHNNTYVNHASLDTLIFSEEVNVSPGSGASQNFPFVVLKEFVIHTAWIDYRNGNPDIYYAAMELGGDELVSEQRISDDSEESSNVQKDPFLIWGNNELICFWSDNRTGDYQIFMANSGGEQSETITIDYIQDWNLLGLPLVVENASYTYLFPGSIDGTLYSFDNGYNLETSLIHGEGYWLRFNEAGSTTITGGSITELTISLSEGWNLISGISIPLNISDIQDPDEIVIFGTVFGFNSAGYLNVEIVEPGKGYWIRTNSSGYITIIDN